MRPLYEIASASGVYSGRAYRPCIANQTQGVFYRLPQWSYTLLFEDAQQAIKRHAMGAPHGIPLTTIRKSQGWEMVCDWLTQTFVTPETQSVITATFTLTQIWQGL